MYQLGPRLRQACRDERGSISLVTMGLFVILLTLALVLSDISSIYLAKRTLSLASESSVQYGMKNLDAESYYSGEYNFNQLLVNSLGQAEVDPGIPINCEEGLNDVRKVLSDFQAVSPATKRGNLQDISLSNFECDGFQINIETSAVAHMPIPIPFINFDEVTIKSHAGAVGERADTNNYYGFDIG
jgi:Flp pilus assembly protein TadG